MTPDVIEDTARAMRDAPADDDWSDEEYWQSRARAAAALLLGRMMVSDAIYGDDVGEAMQDGDPTDAWRLMLRKVAAQHGIEIPEAK